MELTELLPDGTFNGVELIWMAALGCAAVVGQRVLNRHVEDDEPEVHREVDPLDEVWRGSLAWPGRRL